MNTSYRLVIPEHLFQQVRGHLLSDTSEGWGDDEEAALLFCHAVTTTRTSGLVVSRWMPVPPDAFVLQRPDQFAIDSAYIVRQVKQARARSESVILAHSHPGDYAVPMFSGADTHGEAKLYPLLRTRLPDRLHGALVVSPGGATARLVEPSGEIHPASVKIIGRRVLTYVPYGAEARLVSDPLRSRQELIWGSRGQGLLRRATVGIVGAGGTGSLVAQQLIHLGVGRLVVVDPQVLAPSNVGRVVGARQGDIDHTLKVDIIVRIAREIDPHVAVVPIAEDVCQSDMLHQLVEADLLFLCTDSHYSRAVISALGIQYCIPVVDMGFRIDMNAAGDRIASAVGEVRMVVPGGYCLSCAGVLDFERIRAEKAHPDERAAFPGYFTNLNVTDPSVISLNSVIAAQAVSVGLDILVPTMRAVSPFDSYRYNALKGVMSHVAKELDPSCGICGDDGIAALGDDGPLPL